MDPTLRDVLRSLAGDPCSTAVHGGTLPWYSFARPATGPAAKKEGCVGTASSARTLDACRDRRRKAQYPVPAPISTIGPRDASSSKAAETGTA